MQAHPPARICQRSNPRPRADEPETLDCIDKREKQGQEKNSYQDQGSTPLFAWLDAGRRTEGAGIREQGFRSVLRQFRDEVVLLRASLDHPTRSAISAVALTFASRHNTVRFSLAS